MDPHDGTALQKAPERTETGRCALLSALAFFKMKGATDTECAIFLVSLEELEIKMPFSHLTLQHPKHRNRSP